MSRIVSHYVLRASGLIACTALLFMLGCVSLPNSLTYKREQFRFDMPRLDGLLSWEETTAICGVVTSLQAEPSVLYVRRGEQFGVVDHIQTVALDSSGRVLGEPRIVDWSFTGRGLQILREGDVLARRNGETDLVISFPSSACPIRRSSRVSAVVTVVVGDTGTTTSARVRSKR